MTITSGAVAQIYHHLSRPSTLVPVLQFIEVTSIDTPAVADQKNTGTKALRFRIAVSDGVHFGNAMFSANSGDHYFRYQIKTYGLFRISDYVVRDGILFLISIDLVNIQLNSRIGNPVNIESVMKPVASEQPPPLITRTSSVGPGLVMPPPPSIDVDEPDTVAADVTFNTSFPADDPFFERLTKLYVAWIARAEELRLRSIQLAEAEASATRSRDQQISLFTKRVRAAKLRESLRDAAVATAAGQPATVAAAAAAAVAAGAAASSHSAPPHADVVNANSLEPNADADADADAAADTTPIDPVQHLQSRMPIVIPVATVPAQLVDAAGDDDDDADADADGDAAAAAAAAPDDVDGADDPAPGMPPRIASDPNATAAQIATATAAASRRASARIAKAEKARQLQEREWRRQLEAEKELLRTANEKLAELDVENAAQIAECRTAFLSLRRRQEALEAAKRAVRGFVLLFGLPFAISDPHKQYEVTTPQSVDDSVRQLVGLLFEPPVLEQSSDGKVIEPTDGSWEVFAGDVIAGLTTACACDVPPLPARASGAVRVVIACFTRCGAIEAIARSMRVRLEQSDIKLHSASSNGANDQDSKSAVIDYPEPIPIASASGYHATSISPRPQQSSLDALFSQKSAPAVARSLVSSDLTHWCQLVSFLGVLSYGNAKRFVRLDLLSLVVDLLPLLFTHHELSRLPRSALAPAVSDIVRSIVAIANSSAVNWWLLSTQHSALFSLCRSTLSATKYDPAVVDDGKTNPPKFPLSLPSALRVFIADPFGCERAITDRYASELVVYLPLRGVIPLVVSYLSPSHAAVAVRSVRQRSGGGAFQHIPKRLKDSSSCHVIPVLYELLCDSEQRAYAPSLYGVLRAIASDSEYGATALVEFDDAQRSIFASATTKQKKVPLVAILLQFAGYRAGGYRVVADIRHTSLIEAEDKKLVDSTAEITLFALALLHSADRRTGLYRYRNWFRDNYLPKSAIAAAAAPGGDEMKSGVGSDTALRCGIVPPASLGGGFTASHFTRVAANTNVDRRSYVAKLQSIVQSIVSGGGGGGGGGNGGS